MLWDIGIYTASGGDPLKALESGKLHLTLWARDDYLRQPAFLGRREDKSPREVVREAAQ